MAKILIVEDDKLLLEVLVEVLTLNNFEVKSAYSGNQAIQILNNAPVDLVVTDMYMDDGGGQQLIKWCQQNYPKMKILGISGVNLDHAITALDFVEDLGYPTLTKPFSIIDFSNIVKGMLHNQFF